MNSTFFKDNTTITGNIPDGKYKVVLVANDFKSDFYKQEVPGIYWNETKKQYILRFKIVEGERADIAFSVYATEIDLKRMLSEFITQLDMISATPVDACAKLLEEPVTLYRGTEEYKDHSGRIATTKRWSADGKFTKFNTTAVSNTETEAKTENMPF